MRILIAEDDFTSRKLISAILSPYGVCDIAVDGEETVHAFRLAHDEGKPYDLICLDIMMPKMDGQQALKEIRLIEKEINLTGSAEVKVIMMTALDDPKNVIEALHKGGATSYLVKPIGTQKVLKELKAMGFLKT